MTTEFEIEKNRKAFLYTAAILITLLILFFIIRWKNIPPPEPIIQDLMEINLGNNIDGFGEEQPLIKGERGPAKQTVVQPRPQPVQPEKVQPEDDGDGAEIAKAVKPVKRNTPVKDVVPVPPVPKKPKVTYTGAGKGTGNNDNEDNGYKYQGNTPGGKGDNGDPNGHPDSYGNTPGGKIGGPKVTRGNRTIIKYYSFSGDLAKATIYARIKVSASGRGTFVSFDKGSTSSNQAYANAIADYLPNIQFSKADEESLVTVQFNFNVN